MGEYYNWVNVDKREYICPNDFDYGNKLYESVWPGNEFLCALRELLSDEWAGDHVLFMGDEKDIPADTENETLKMLYRHTVNAGYGNVYDSLAETYRNVSCLFSDAESEVRGEILNYLADLKNGATDLPNEYGIDASRPFDGLFLRNGRDFPFTVDHTKKVCYSLGKTKILSSEAHEELDHVDPLPLLMCYGRVTDPGAWLGDIIGVADAVPAGYALLSEIYVDW